MITRRTSATIAAASTLALGSLAVPRAHNDNIF
jgi:hypothetical protein